MIKVREKPMMVTGISRNTYPEQVAEHLISYIDEADLKPGALLPSVAILASRFAVSRPVIREALKSLSALGVITIIKGKGAVIRPMDDQLPKVFFNRAIRLEEQPLTRLMEVRIPLEVQSAKLAAQHCTPADLKLLEQLVQDMGANLEQGERYASLDAEYHVTISQAAHNAMLSFLILSIRTALQYSMREIRTKREAAGLLGYEQRSHESILDEIKQHNPEKAGKAMETHLSETMTLIRQIEGSSGH
jgi:GntR family transcriptional repressor for pyruvate dehydrogenase complex